MSETLIESTHYDIPDLTVEYDESVPIIYIEQDPYGHSVVIAISPGMWDRLSELVYVKRREAW